MKQQYTFLRLFSFLPILMAAFLWLAGGMVYGQSQTFTSGQTWDVPCGATSVTIEVYGGGGGGGGSACNNCYGGGGGSGFYTISTETVTPGETLTITVGTGGIGGTTAPTAGGNGGSSSVSGSFGAVTSAGGNGGGVGDDGLGGTGCNDGFQQSGGQGADGGDGCGPLGGTGGADGGNGPGANGTNYGAGGGGGEQGAGGNGAPGLVVISWTTTDTADAGPDQVLATCATSTTLVGDTPLSEQTGTWTVSPVGPTFSDANDPNATVSNMTPGVVYTFTWTHSGICGTYSDNMTVTTSEGVGCWDYCDPTVTTGTTYTITDVTFNTISNTSTSPGLPMYNDNTGTCTDVIVGSSHDLCVSGTTGANGINVIAYFDWNNDGDFNDAGETINVGSAPTGAWGPLCTTINIPAGATLGTTVMRIMAIRQGDPNGPCATGIPYGEIEDYCVNIIACTTTVPNAGPDQDLTGTCNNSATLAGNVITQGTGFWVLTSGSGTITDPFDPTTTVTNLGPGTNTFEWQVTDDPCPPLSDAVNIINNDLPSLADAGPDTESCSGSFSLTGNLGGGESGQWTCVSGCGSITSPALPSGNASETFTLSGGVGTTATLQWTITDGTSGCTSSDDVILTVISGVTPANAGPDQIDICYTAASTGSTVLAANTPSVGTGTWSIVSNSTGGTLTDNTDPTSSITGINATGTIVLDWIISSAGCSNSTDQVTINTILCNADNACVAQPLVVTSGTCSYSTFSNAGLTEITGVPELTCDESTGPDIWFSVVVPASGQFQANVADVSGIDPMLGAYDGDCSSPESSGCIDGVGTDVGPLTYAGVPGSTVYLRVNPTSTITTEGNFNICAYEATTATISEVLPGATTTISCGSTLNFYDPGGQGGTTTTNTSQPPPAGNYSNNTGAYWEICPDDPSQYVQVTFNEFTVENGFDKLIIMSADTVIAQWTGNDGQGDVVTSINPGECLQFILQSDYIWTAEGWEALVECTNTPVPAQITNACEVRNCNGGCGVWVCLDGVYDTEAGAGAGIDEVNEVTGGCWGAAGEVATSWFYFTTNQAGSLGFEFIPSNNGHNINFALYGPSLDGVPPCPLSTGDAPIRCSFVDIGGGNTGLYGDSTATGVITTNPASTDYYDGLDGDGFAAPVDVQAGETYALVVDVYQNGQPPTETEIDFSGVELDCTVLPIELADFSGVNQGEYNLLSWITYSERNNDYFTIYRSVDGYHWEEVGKIDGAGNSSRPLHYTLNDMEPHFPITYYRLKQTDIDGEFKWSETISISTIKKSEDEFITDLFPNPSSTYATFTYTGHNTAEPLNVQVVNTFGEVVVNLDYTKVTKNMPATIVTGQLAEGLYQVTFRQGNKLITKRLAVIR